MKYIRNEYFQGNGISDKSSRHTWTQAGELDTRSRARQMARSILEEPLDAKIPSEIQEEIRQELPIHI
jgi:trimethylamine--corrinoid protein Co-methyltransferase